MTKHRNNHHTSGHGLATTMCIGQQLASVSYRPTDSTQPHLEILGPWVVSPHESARKERHRTLYGARMALRDRMRRSAIIASR